MIKEVYGYDSEIHDEKVFFVLFEDEDGWYRNPDVWTERELGKELEHVHYGGEQRNFKLFDADSDGNLHPCQLVSEPWIHHDNDTATGITQILCQGEQVGTIRIHIDMRA